MTMGFFDKVFKKKGDDEVGGQKKMSMKLAKRYPEYYRLHVWLESRLGPLSAGEDEQELKKKLLKLLRDEKEKHPDMKLYGLEAYIKKNKYRKMLGS
jgi:hypothetical protein